MSVYRERERYGRGPVTVRVWPRIWVRVRVIIHFIFWHFVRFFIFWHFVLWHFVLWHFVLWHFVLWHFVPWHFVQACFWHFVLWHFVRIPYDAYVIICVLSNANFNVPYLSLRKRFSPEILRVI